MPIATGTALAIGLGASAASSAVGAKMQANAAKNAAKTQSASADRAMQLLGGPGAGGGGGLFNQAMAAQDRQNQMMQQMYAPYTSTAPASLSALHAFVGLPGASNAQTMVPYGAYGPPMRNQAFGQPFAPGMMGGPQLPIMKNPGGGMQPMSSLYGPGRPPMIPAR